MLDMNPFPSEYMYKNSGGTSGEMLRDISSIATF